MSQIRDGANSASITGGNVRTTGPTPRGQNPARRATAVRRVDRDLELDRRTNEEAHMMSRLLQEAEEEEYEDESETDSAYWDMGIGDYAWDDDAQAWYHP